MASAAVLYKTKHGASQKYAEMIKAAIGADMYAADKVSESQLVKYSTVVICGGVYNDQWGCEKELNKFRNVLNGKLLVLVMATWAADHEALHTRDLKEKYLAKVVISPKKIFSVPGHIDSKKLGFGDKLALGGVKKKAKAENQFSVVGMIDGVSGGVDKAAVDRIVTFIKEH